MKIINVLVIALVLIGGTSVAPQKTYAVEPPAPGSPEEFYGCIGTALATYMNVIVDAKASGKIPSNIKLLSPAFNMTSYTFTGIVGGMKAAGAKFDINESKGIAGIAGNVYNVAGQPISSYMNTVRTQFGGGPYFITETGTFDHSNNGIEFLKSEFANFDVDIHAALLFNAMNTNTDWSGHAFSESQISELSSKKPGVIGINFATFYESADSYYQQASQRGLKWTLEISDAEKVENTKRGIAQAHKYKMTPIVRIGVGGSSHGFDDPNIYVDFLAKIASAGGTIYALAGPNEPDLEPWIAPDCKFNLPGLSLACEGPYQGENQPNLTEVIGHNGQEPWRISGYFRQKAKDRGSLASQITASIVLRGKQFFHTDFSEVVNQLVGSVNPGASDYIENRVKDMRAPPTLSSQVPGSDFRGSFDVVDTRKKEDESYTDFTKRLMPAGAGGVTSDKQLGQKSEIPVQFVGCIQNPTCDYSEEGAKTSCIKTKYTGLCLAEEAQGGIKTIKGDCKCQEVNQNSECIELGRKFLFDGTIDLIEPAEIFAMERVYLDLKRKYVRLPNQPDRYIASTQKDSLAKTGINNQTSAYSAITTTLESLKNPSSTKASTAKAETTPPACDPTTHPYQCAAECTESGCYEIPGHGPIWRPELGIDGSGKLSYQVCMIGQGQQCNLDHISIKVNGSGPDGGNGDLYTNNGACYGAGAGGSNDPSKNLPGLGGTLSPEQCETVSFSIGGGRTNGGICDSIPQSLSQSCTVCMDKGGIVTSTCEPGAKPLAAAVDCRVCTSWAPGSTCKGVDAPSLITKEECADGKCKKNINLQTGNIQYPEANNPELTGGGWWQSFWKGLLNWFAGNATEIDIGNLKCKRQNDSCTYYDLNASCQDGSGTSCTSQSCNTGCPCTGTYNPGGWICAYNVDEYLLYAYPLTNISDLNKNRSSDMEINNALFKIPGITDNYFEPEYAKAPVSFQLEILKEGSDLKDSGGKIIDKDQWTNSIKNTDGEGDFLNPNTYLFLETPTDKSIKTMNVGYYDFYQPQVSGYCAGRSFLSLPGEDRIQLCNPYEFPGTSSGGAHNFPLTPIDPNHLLIVSSDVQAAIDKAANDPNHQMPPAVLKAILETEAGTGFDYSTYICTRNSVKATGPMQITDGTVFNYLYGNESIAWNIKEWTPGEDFSTDGRCNIEYAMEIAARILKGKANGAVNLGYISNSDFNNVQTAIYASGGYYGTRSCGPDTATQGRWGTNISYCDYFIHRVGKHGGYQGQVCTTLNPSCDGVGPPGTNGQGANAPSTQVNTNTKTPPVTSEVGTLRDITYTKDSRGDTQKQKDFLLDIENLMNKYKDQIKSDKPTLKDLPPEMIEEIKALAEKYR